MKQKYKHIQFTKRMLALIGVLNAIVDEYHEAGFILTLRQLFYQMVARGVAPNTEQSYNQIGETVNKAKLAGLIDWDAIEDRTRAFRGPARWRSPGDIMSSAVKSFHMDMWENQDRRVYAIIEKEALAGVFAPVCRELDVPMLSARGYPSGSVLREFASRLPLGYLHVFLHFGDHDPSGIDMSRDLQERLEMFGEGVDIQFERIALNMDQIEEVKPPPNPAKLSDSRAKAYIKRFGPHSWELDALDPRYLQELAREHIVQHMDTEQWAARVQHVESKRKKLSFIRSMFFKE